MSAIGHLSMIFISVDLLEGSSALQQKIQLIKNQSEGVLVSNVYKREQRMSLTDRLITELVAVIKAETFMSVENLAQFLKDKIGSYSVILTFDSDVHLLPGLSLPHPILHADPLVLRCAAEVWGSYEHPVLGQTLNELVQLQKNTKNFEFYSQGTHFIQDRKET